MRLTYILMYIKGIILFGFRSFLFSLSNYIIKHKTMFFFYLYFF